MTKTKKSEPKEVEKPENNIIGITRIRNEESIIKDTLDHYSQFCSGVYVYDDCSTDNTVKICKSHKIVKDMIIGTHWSPDRYRAEFELRQAVLEMALKDNPEWIIYFDADERIDWDFSGYEDFDGIVMKLFDFYITEKDKNLPYHERQWLGPEYRNILMMFRASACIGYFMRDQREAILKPGSKILNAGYVKHYGKAVSVKEFELTCDYYSKYFGEPYKSKWIARKGKAIHNESDFGRPLITWDEKEENGVPLN